MALGNLNDYPEWCVWKQDVCPRAGRGEDACEGCPELGDEEEVTG